MNPTTAEAPPPQPQQLIQPHRPSTSCDRHPEENFTGFCPSCLCERLAVLDPSTSSSSASTSRKPPTSSTAAAALRAIFKPPIGGGSTAAANKARPTSFFPELRRTKSFSASKNEGFSGVFEPQRKSCDVRVRNTLWNLFHQDDGRNPHKKDPTTTTAAEVEIETRSFQAPVFESKEEEEDEIETEISDGEDRIEICDEPIVVANVIEDRVPEILEEEEEEEEAQFQQFQQFQQPPPPPPPQQEAAIFDEEDLKPMKDHLDLDSQTKKKIAGSFWSAASVFSKKLQKWRQKQKLKKRRGGGGSATLPVEKPIGRQFRETQSEIADYGFGRRSCDTDPRFSLDAGRVSFDDPRYSFDEPRASWDGYLTGRTFPRMPTMLSVVEDAPAAAVHIPRCDAQIPVEEPPMNPIEEETVPGGSAQTRDYYSDSTTRRRKSLDRSNSIRKTAAAVVAEIDEMKSSVSNATVVPDRVDLREFYNSNSMRDDCSEAFETGSFRGGGEGNGERNKGCKKSRRWSKAWNIWSFINRRGGGNKDEDEDRYITSVRGNGVVERSFSESWPELRGGERNGEVKGFNPKIMRSNSSASWRNGSYGFGGVGGSFGSMRKSNGNGNAGVVEPNGNGGKKKDDHIVLERNRSARYSPNHADPGMLRFYLTPMRSSWRSGTRSNPAHSIARSVLRLY